MPGRFSFRSARKISSRARSTSSTRRRSSISTTTRWVRPTKCANFPTSTRTRSTKPTTSWSTRFPTSTMRSRKHVLEEKPITPEMLKAGIRRQTIANKFVPVVGGSAFKNKGVQYLVDAVIDYLPEPARHSAGSRAWSPTRTRRWKRRRTTTASSARSRSSSGAIRSSASWSSSASIPAR